MSTYQPPSGQPPEGTPYTPPQDPWAAAHDQGSASVPTDPIPQQYDPYAPGLVPADVWSQQTVVHGGQQFAYAPQPPKSRALLIVGVFLAVLVLGGGGAFGAWYLLGGPGGTVDPNASASASVSPSATELVIVTSCVQPGGFDPCALKVGDCFINVAESGPAKGQTVPCTTATSFKVLKVNRGADIPGGLPADFDGQTQGEDKSKIACKGVDKLYTWYAFNDQDPARDGFYCLGLNS